MSNDIQQTYFMSFKTIMFGRRGGHLGDFGICLYVSMRVCNQSLRGV